ncbi:MAG: DUF3015 domain-containing protein [Nitrospira sp.]|nr:DUF3015 domain-containing protein [Nitrospira sp.]MCP9441222.1 DUF3015 domain-containing protein [Nitrospira sp.]
MRKLSMVVVIGLAMVVQGGIALAAGTPDTGPGCGLGKIAWQNYPHAKTKGAQILMATTNGSFGTQTFGISTGTMGCTDDGRWWAEQKATMFAELNADALAQEMAQGRGEHLASMATLLGVPQQQHEAFFTMAQGRYAALASSGDLSPASMVKALNEGIAVDPALSHIALN